MSSQKTANIAVMISRPGKPGADLAGKLQEQGCVAWHIPTLKIVAEKIVLPKVNFDQVLFISPNAVKFSVETNLELRAMLPDMVLAVGPGTASCLQQSGFRQVTIPAEFNSEGLLKLPQLQKVTAQQLLIVKGKGGRSMLGKSLIERGAICHYLEVYCRVAIQLKKDLWKEFLASGDRYFITVASVDALNALTCNSGSNFRDDKFTLVVASERIERKAVQQGYQQIIVVESASNDAMLAAIINMVNTD